MSVTGMFWRCCRLQGTILIAIPSHASRYWISAWLCKLLPDWEQTRGHHRGGVPRPVWDLDLFSAKADTPTRNRVINLYWLRLSVFLISFTSSIVSTLRSVNQASLWRMMMTEFLGIAMNCSDRYIRAPHRTRSMLLNTKNSYFLLNRSCPCKHVDQVLWNDNIVLFICAVVWFVICKQQL